MRRKVIIAMLPVVLLLTASVCPGSDGGNKNPPPTVEIHKP